MPKRKFQRRPDLRRKVVMTRIERMVPHMIELDAYSPYLAHHLAVLGRELVTGKVEKGEVSTAVGFLRNYCDKVESVLRLTNKTNQSASRVGYQIPAELLAHLERARKNRVQYLELLERIEKKKK